MAIVRKIRRSLRRDGIAKTIRLCFRNLMPSPRRDDRPSQFDMAYGISTEGRVDLGDLDIGSQSDIWGVHYSPTPPFIFDRIMSLLPPPEEYSFIDLGSGKARVVLMAARFPFRIVVGVEFSRELCDIAKTNLEKFRPHVVARQVDLVCEDAALFQFPEGPAIVYCYFAFEKEVLVKVIDSLLRRKDETIFVYYNAHYPELFTGFELMHSEGVISIWRRPAERSNQTDTVRAHTTQPSQASK